MSIILEKAFPVKRPTRLYSAEAYHRWADCSGVYAYVATSPPRPGREPVFSPDWQREEVSRIAHEKGLRIIETAVEQDRISRRMGVLSRPKLSRLITLAQYTGDPIVAWDWSRFLRPKTDLYKLDKFGVDFVTVMEVDCSEVVLRKLRRRITDKYTGVGTTMLLRQSLPFRGCFQGIKEQVLQGE